MDGDQFPVPEIQKGAQRMREQQAVEYIMGAGAERENQAAGVSVLHAAPLKT